MDYEVEFSKQLKHRILKIVKRSYKGEGHLLSESDMIILFHWIRHMDEPIYDFVPKKYRLKGEPNKWDIKKI